MGKKVVQYENIKKQMEVLENKLKLAKENVVKPTPIRRIPPTRVSVRQPFRRPISRSFRPRFPWRRRSR